MIRELCRWIELRWRLKRCKTPQERTSVRRSVSQKYRTKKRQMWAPPKPAPLPRDMKAEAHESELRG